MSGKKFVVVFSIVTFVVGAIFLVSMKHSYDTRPQIPQNLENTSTPSAAPSSENK